MTAKQSNKLKMEIHDIVDMACEDASERLSEAETAYEQAKNVCKDAEKVRNNALKLYEHLEKVQDKLAGEPS